jgi:tetratricopeptide (TPR) repeat protein
MTDSGARDSAPRAPRVPNNVLRGIREAERQTRAEFAEAMARVAQEIGEEVYPDAKYVQRLESGDITWPHTAYRKVLTRLCARPAAELGFTPPASSVLGSSHAFREAPARVNLTLREAVWGSGMEVTEFARKVGVDPKSAERWITRGRTPHSRHRWKASQILGRDESELWPEATSRQEISSRQAQQNKNRSTNNQEFGVSFDPGRIADRVSELATWAESANMGDGTLSALDGATFQLAHDSLTVPPFQAGERADALIERISGILRNGHQRLAQTRDLYVIAGKLCAILSWISSDLGQLPAADAHASNGWTLAEQADHNGLRASILSARSKNEFLRKRYSDAATLARRGYEFKPPGSMGVLLACQEADALQATGRIEDARQALIRSERLQDSISQRDEFGGIFGCGVARQANYSISTYLRAGLVDQAMRHVERAEVAWRDGEEWAYGTWAQVQIGAAIAHLMSGEIESAVIVMERVLDQPEEQRLATLVSRLRREVAPLLINPAIRRSKFAVILQEKIEHYEQSPIRALPAEGEL